METGGEVPNQPQEQSDGYGMSMPKYKILNINYYGYHKGISSWYK